MDKNRQCAIERHIGLTPADAAFLNGHRQLPVCKTFCDLLRMQIAATDGAGMALLESALADLRKTILMWEGER